MSPIVEFEPKKGIEVALRVAEVVCKKKDWNFTVVPAGVNFSAEGTVIANLIHGDEGSQSTLNCDKEIAGSLRKQQDLGKIKGLIFLEPQKKKQ
jgi:hypothetical protein